MILVLVNKINMLGANIFYNLVFAVYRK